MSTLMAQVQVKKWCRKGKKWFKKSGVSTTGLKIKYWCKLYKQYSTKSFVIGPLLFLQQ